MDEYAYQVVFALFLESFLVKGCVKLNRVSRASLKAVQSETFQVLEKFLTSMELAAEADQLGSWWKRKPKKVDIEYVKSVIKKSYQKKTRSEDRAGR